MEFSHHQYSQKTFGYWGFRLLKSYDITQREKQNLPKSIRDMFLAFNVK